MDRFQAALFEASDLLLKTGVLLVPLERCRALVPLNADAVARVKGELADVLSRIDAGDPQGAARAMEAHLVGDIAELDRLRREHPAFFEGG